MYMYLYTQPSTVEFKYFCGCEWYSRNRISSSTLNSLVTLREASLGHPQPKPDHNHPTLQCGLYSNDIRIEAVFSLCGRAVRSLYCQTLVCWVIQYWPLKKKNPTCRPVNKRVNLGRPLPTAVVCSHCQACDTGGTN